MAIFTNQATLSHGDAVSYSNVVQGEILEVLSAEKTALRKTFRAGDRIPYSIRLVNTGSCDFSGLSMLDTLGSYSFQNVTFVPLTYVEGSLRYSVNGVMGEAPRVHADTSLLISDISVPRKSTVELMYEAVINACAPLSAGSTIENVATISGFGTEPLTAIATITAEEGALLILSKSLCPAAVEENGELTYTFVIQNIGNREAAENVSITDTFAPALENVAVFYNGMPWTCGENYIYSEQSGLFRTGAGEITVPAATYTQSPQSGAFVMTPGVATVQVTGTVS